MWIPEISESMAQPGPLRPKQWEAPDPRAAVVWICFPFSARRSGAEPQAPRRRSLRLGGAGSVRGRDVTHLGWEVPARLRPAAYKSGVGRGKPESVLKSPDQLSGSRGQALPPLRSPLPSLGHASAPGASLPNETGRDDQEDVPERL